jgi:hypothetical protein
MAKLKYVDNLVYPKEKEVIKFEGPEPFRLYGAMRKLLLDTFELAGKDIFEPQLKWDATGETKYFFVKWNIAKSIDRWSKLELSMTFQGSQNSRTRLGDMSFSMKPKFVTEVEVGFLQRPFWWIFYRFFYRNQRVESFYRAKSIFNQFKANVGAVYGMEPAPSE